MDLEINEKVFEYMANLNIKSNLINYYKLGNK